MDAYPQNPMSNDLTKTKPRPKLELYWILDPKNSITEKENVSSNPLFLFITYIATSSLSTAMCKYLFFLEKVWVERSWIWDSVHRSHLHTESHLVEYIVFENHRKCLFQHCERSELRLHFESQKFIKNAKNGPELAVKLCYQIGHF